MTGTFSPPLQPVQPSRTPGEIFARVLADLEADGVITPDQIVQTWLEIDTLLGREDRLVERSFHIVSSLMRNGLLSIDVASQYVGDRLQLLLQS